MSRATRVETLEVNGLAMSCAVDEPDGDVAGCAIVAHPHPLQGGTRDNKVAHTVARALVSRGWVCWRPNFRGVGESGGSFDDGRGESDDIEALVDIVRERQRAAGRPDALVLAGFSFGSFVAAQVASRHLGRGQPLRRLILVGCAAGKWDVPTVRADTAVIHGELDDVVPLTGVMAWARPQSLPVTVIPDADHFFHRKLVALKTLVLGLELGTQIGD